ncbi:MAG: response regulator, partial [Nitrospirales bacterium]
FQVFTQADSSMSRKFGGSGLGLAICKQLAELMNGTVGVRSQPSQGSIFWCDIPFHGSRPVLSPRNIALSLSGKEVWVMCPLESSAWVMSQLINEVGAKAVRVDSIQHAQTLIEQKQASVFDVAGIIVGGNLENLGTRQWLETIRFSPLFRDIKVWNLEPFWFPQGEKIITFDGIITLPIHREQFYRCILGETGYRYKPDLIKKSEQHDVENSHRANGLSAISYERENEAPSVLVVEDNAVNQTVAAGMLRKLGCHVMIVSAGNQALQILKETDVDCIVMDWELPDMDGLAITRAIRELENAGKLVGKRTYWRRHHAPVSSPVSHVPIIGMTAHVLPEQGQQCLMSGMDECLSKPVHLHDFEKVLRRWVGFIPVAPVSPVLRTGDHSASSGSNLVFVKQAGTHNNLGKYPEREAEVEEYDVSVALRAMEGDEDLLYSLFGIFNKTSPGLIQEMQKSLQMKDRQNFQRQAHQMKGALSAVHARHEAKLAERLEKLASFASFSNLQSKLVEMENMMQKLVGLFRGLVSIKGGRNRKSSETTSCPEASPQDEMT